MWYSKLAWWKIPFFLTNSFWKWSHFLCVNSPMRNQRIWVFRCLLKTLFVWFFLHVFGLMVIFCDLWLLCLRYESLQICKWKYWLKYIKKNGPCDCDGDFFMFTIKTTYSSQKVPWSVFCNFSDWHLKFYRGKRVKNCYLLD